MEHGVRFQKCQNERNGTLSHDLIEWIIFDFTI